LINGGKGDLEIIHPREREICVPLCLIHFLNNVKNTTHVVSKKTTYIVSKRLCKKKEIMKKQKKKRVYIADVKSNAFG